MNARFQTAAEFCDALAYALGVSPADGSRVSALPYDMGEAAWFQVTNPSLPLVVSPMQPTLGGQARPPSLRPSLSRGRGLAVLALLGGVCVIAIGAALFWTTQTRARTATNRSLPERAQAALSAAPSSSAAPSPSAAPSSSAASSPSAAPSSPASASPAPPSPSTAAPPLGAPSHTPSAAVAEPAATAGSDPSEPASTAPSGSSKPRAKPASKPKRSTEWGF
jgi:cytoskeletal protein RodZ